MILKFKSAHIGPMGIEIKCTGLTISTQKFRSLIIICNSVKTSYIFFTSFIVLKSTGHNLSLLLLSVKFICFKHAEICAISSADILKLNLIFESFFKDSNYPFQPYWRFHRAVDHFYGLGLSQQVFYLDFDHLKVCCLSSDHSQVKYLISNPSKGCCQGV